MAITNHVRIQVATTGLTSKGGSGVDLSFTLTSAEFDHSVLDLASGDNTITIPGSDPRTLIFIPPTTNTQTLQLKGAGGDTGISLAKTKPSVISIEDGDDVIINAGGAVTDCEVYIL